jgi:hypothetical protein
MLFMVTLNYEPQNRDEIVKRRAEKGALVPEGVKTIGEWTSIGGGKVFRLVETEDPSAMMQGVMAWGDLGKTEVLPVMDSEDVMKMWAGQ